jgi:hypothetical protein
MEEKLELPPSLLDEFAKGNVVAFVGAGFSRAAGLPLWGEMVTAVATEGGLPLETLAVVRGLCETGTASNLDMAAQLIKDGLSSNNFDEAVRKKLTVDLSKLPSAMQNRLAWLNGLPLCAIVTTNYDNLLSGVNAGNPSQLGAVAEEILRSNSTEFERLEKLAFYGSFWSF